MKKSRFRLTVALMVSSLALLLILQGFWLQSSYERAYYGVRREVSNVFRNTVLTMRDSLFARNIEALPDESPFFGGIAGMRKDPIHDTTEFVRHQLHVYFGEDTALTHTERAAMVKRLTNTQKLYDGNRSFVVRLGPDTLNIDSVRYAFTEALIRNGQEMPFEIRHMKMAPPQYRHTTFDPIAEMRRNRERNDDRNNDNWSTARIYSDTLITDFVRLTPVHRYSATLAGMRGILIREIAPQILFSVFLTLLTSVSFIFMYRSLRSQQRLMEMKNDFINNVTHELKTPVATVSVALEALKSFHAMENPRLAEEYLDIARNELSRLSHMTDKILKTAVYENRGIDFMPEPVNLDELTQQALDNMKLVFDKYKATVSYAKTGTNFVLQGSHVHLTNLVHNLLDNALKYSSLKPVIHITLQNSTEQLRLSVQDQGIGIAPEYQKKVFEKFFRVPSGDIHNTKGYGLGLSYVSSVVTHHHGTIQVESTPGKGSCFIITLPKKMHTPE